MWNINAIIAKKEELISIYVDAKKLDIAINNAKKMIEISISIFVLKKNPFINNLV